MNQTTLKLFIFSMVIMTIGIVPDATAQKRWNVQVRPSISFPKNTSGGNMSTGFGIEGKTFYNFNSAFGAYAGWGWNLFPAATKENFSYEESGLIFGFQYSHRIAASKLKYFVGTGGVYTHLEAQNKNRDISADSGHEPGWEIQSGLIFTIEQKFQINPGIRYRSVFANDLQYWSFGVGFQW